MDNRIKEVEKPIGDFILEQTDIYPAESYNGNYYHYSDVCIILNRFKAFIQPSSVVNKSIDVKAIENI